MQSQPNPSGTDDRSLVCSPRIHLDTTQYEQTRLGGYAMVRSDLTHDTSLTRTGGVTSINDTVDRLSIRNNTIDERIVELGPGGRPE